MTTRKIPCVFIDTNCLLGENIAGDAWNRLVGLHKEKKILLCFSQIVQDEWISNIRDSFIFHSVEAKKHIDENKKNPLQAFAQDQNVGLEVVDEKFFETTAKKNAERFVKSIIEENEICIVKITAKHSEEVFRKYFSWEPPFDTAKDSSQLCDKAKRKARKNHIPDGFIIEAINSYLAQGKEVALICKDGLLKKTLSPELDSNTYETVAGFISKFEAKEADESEEETTTLYQRVEDPLPDNELDVVLATAINDNAKHVYLRVLGYVHWLDAPAKEALVSVIADLGFDLGLINASITILSQPSLKLIKDTGNHILPINKSICAEAADRIRPEILEALDEE